MQTIAAFVAVVATLVAFSLIMAVPTMLLWDWLMPELFGLKTITLFQAWGLNFLCGMLFKSHNSTSK
jgi:hypothetical protein